MKITIKTKGAEIIYEDDKDSVQSLYELIQLIETILTYENKCHE